MTTTGCSRSFTWTEWEVWFEDRSTPGTYHSAGSAMPDEAFMRNRFEEHKQLGTNPIIKSRTVTQTWHPWTDEETK